MSFDKTHVVHWILLRMRIVYKRSGDKSIDLLLLTIVAFFEHKFVTFTYMY